MEKSALATHFLCKDDSIGSEAKLLKHFTKNSVLAVRDKLFIENNCGDCINRFDVISENSLVVIS